MIFFLQNLSLLFFTDTILRRETYSPFQTYMLCTSKSKYGKILFWFWSARLNELCVSLTTQRFIYYLIRSGVRKPFCKIMQHIYRKAWFSLWFNMGYHERRFLWDYSLTQVTSNGNMFQKNIPHVLSNLLHKITRSLIQNFVISRSWDNFR